MKIRWKTRITEFFDCKYPIMQGGLSGIGDWKLAAAVSNTGAIGCITAHLYQTPGNLRDAIRKTREVTNMPFAVNISIGMTRNIEEMFDACFEENIPIIETSAYKPDDYAQRIKEAGMKWVHKGATVAFCKHAEKLGADAVVLVGLEGYGFKNFNQLPTFTSIAHAKRHIKVPLFAAGGIADGRTFLGALALGADGIYMGTAFEATQESRLNGKIKQNIVNAIPNHPDLIYKLLALPDAKAYMEMKAAKDKMPLDKWITAMKTVHLKDRRWKNASHIWQKTEGLGEEKDQDIGSRGDRVKDPYSFACAYIEDIPTCKDLIGRIIREAEEILESWQFLKAR